jgi:hypothetical protein
LARRTDPALAYEAGFKRLSQVRNQVKKTKVLAPEGIRHGGAVDRKARYDPIGNGKACARERKTM